MGKQKASTVLDVCFNNVEPRTRTRPEGTKYAPTPRGAGSSFRRLPEELRALASEAYALWRDLARERANPYGDHTGCLLAGRMAVDATRWEDGLVILAAIVERMDEKSSPRWIPEWSRELGGSRREEARKVQRMTERDQSEEITEVMRREMADFGRKKLAEWGRT